MIVHIGESSDREYMEISRAITKFNFAHLPKHASDNMTSLGYVIRGEKIGLIGGIYGKLLLGNNLSIDTLWVDEQFRNLGYATQLIQTLEDAARKLQAKLSIVDTFDFQALDFYKKNGYSVFGILENSPCHGNKRYYLQKAL